MRDLSYDSLSDRFSINTASAQLTRIPKMFKAPKLTYIGFAFLSISSIESYAISHLPLLEYLKIIYNMGNLTLSTDSLNLPVNNNFQQLDITYTTLEFQPGFITNLNPTASFTFEGSMINTFDKEVFYDIFNSFASCAECDHNHNDGHIIDFGSLNCDCNILWILEEQAFLDVINEYRT